MDIILARRSADISVIPEIDISKEITEDKFLQIADELLKAGLNINIPTSNQIKTNGFAPSFLLSALKDSDVKLAKLLLKHGAQKFYHFAPSTYTLIKQKFTEKEENIYKQAKMELRDEHVELIRERSIPFLLGVNDKTSIVNTFPKDILDNIIKLNLENLSGRAKSSNQDLINDAKRQIKEFKERQALLDVEGNANPGNHLAIAHLS